MKAVLIRKYGGPEVLELAEVSEPTPRGDEVIVQVHASSVNPVDWLVREGQAKSFVRISFPAILGCDLAGEVVALGPQARRFAIGDQVFAAMPHDYGAHAERVALSERLLAKKPARLSMEEAAALGVVALTALGGVRRRGQVQAGQRVLINGAASAVGMSAVQIAKAQGAHVTAVCSAAGATLVTALGADQIIDYQTTDFTTGDQKYDLVFDCVGTRPYAQCERVLQGRCVHVTTKPGIGTFVRQLLNPLCRVQVYGLVTTGDGEELEYVKTLVDSGQLRVILDKVFPVAEVAQAQEYSKSGRAKGKIVLKFPIS